MKNKALLLLASAALVAAPASAGKKTEIAAASPKAQKSVVPVAVVAKPQGQAQLPPPEAMIIMIRSSLVALSQANQTNNYTVLNAMGSTNFRQANSPARLAQIFEPFRTNNIDLAPVVFVTPQLTQTPVMKDGRLQLKGFFPTQPMRVDYDLTFEPAGGIWRLFGISVNLNRVAVPAPRAPAQQPVANRPAQQR